MNKVLDWFKEDFGGNNEGIKDLLWRSYAEGTLPGGARWTPDTKLEFFDYDWTLNDIAR